jgi:hypothetical protein
MKTSTKLFIAFSICLPLSALAYNLLLKRQYMAGNLIPDVTTKSGDKFVFKQLPRFKYLVVDCSMYGGYSQDFPMKVNIISNSNKKAANTAWVNIYYQSLFDTRMVKDTLFMRLYREKPIGTWDEKNHNDVFSLHLNSDVEYIHTRAGAYTVAGNFKPNQMTIVAGWESTMDINNLKTDKLNLIARDGANVNLEYNKTITTMAYSLFDKSTITLDRTPIKEYIPMHIDSTAQIKVTIKGAGIQKYLTTHPTSENETFHAMGITPGK